MKVTAASARQFSESLLRVHAAEDETGIQSALTAARATLNPEEWMVGLLQRHAECRRNQLGSGIASLRTTGNLTRRELEVLQRVALGETDATIGRVLGISAKTASKHVENILRKLGVETRTTAASYVFGQRG
jgi:DNA-binding NarL/FixJ family response regulator